MRIALLSRLAFDTVPVWIVSPHEVTHAEALAAGGCILIASRVHSRDGQVVGVQVLEVTEIGLRLLARAEADELTNLDWVFLT